MASYKHPRFTLRKNQTEQQLVAAWREYVAIPVKQRPPLSPPRQVDRRIFMSVQAVQRAWHIQAGQLIEAYGSASAALPAVKRRQETEPKNWETWWEPVHTLLACAARRRRGKFKETAADRRAAQEADDRWLEGK